MKFTFANKFPKDASAIFPIFLRKKKFIKSGKRDFDKLVEKALKAKIFEGASGATYAQTPQKKNLPKNIVFASFGDPEKLKPKKVLAYAAQALKVVKKERCNTISFYVPGELNGYGQTLAESLILTKYNPARYKTGKALKKAKEHDVQSCVFVGQNFAGQSGKLFKETAQKGASIADAVNEVRDIVNGPPNITTPEFMEEEALKLGKQFGYKITIFKKKELEKMGMNTILAVNRGSKKEARLLVMEYQPEGAAAEGVAAEGVAAGNEASKKPATAEKSATAEKPIVLVGKGIIFDSGGYNLKPTGYIENMHLDMAGAASVIGVFKLLKKLRVKVPVIGIAPITENCIDSDSYKPSEIIKSYSGKTIEITNTDAEGRLVLCDALAYAVKTFKPRYLIDLATLTGACMVALGERYAGLFGNDRELGRLIRRAGTETDELTWPLPIHPDFEEAMKGELTDLQNAEPDRYAGASKAAAFLKAFVGKTKWAHLDIAGPAYVSKPKKYESKRATGYGVRLMIKFLEYLNKE